MAPKRSQSRQKALRQGGATPRQAAPATAAAGGSATKGARRQPSRSYRTPRRSFWTGPYPYLGILAAVLIAVIVIVVIARNDTGSTKTGNIEAAIHDVTHVNASIYDQVGVGLLTQKTVPISVTKSPADETGADGKPLVLFVGGEYCPYCAADRWVILSALSRFGTFSGVESMFSSSTDVYPNTPTFTFLHAKYQSKYFDLQTVEMYDRNEASLQTPTQKQQQLMSTYGFQGVPFLLISGQYLGTTPFSPQVLAGKDQQQVASALSDPSQESTKDIIGNANLLAASICKITGSPPASVCQSQGVQAAAPLLG